MMVWADEIEEFLELLLLPLLLPVLLLSHSSRNRDWPCFDILTLQPKLPYQSVVLRVAARDLVAAMARGSRGLGGSRSNWSR